jgi:hypothetical protein
MCAHVHVRFGDGAVFLRSSKYQKVRKHESEKRWEKLDLGQHIQCSCWTHDVQKALQSDQWELCFLHRTFATMRVLVCSQYEPTPGMGLLAYTHKKSFP